MPRGSVRPIGPAIVLRRSQRGWTQDGLAWRAGYSKRQIERIENGGSTKLSTIIDIAGALECRPEELIETIGIERAQEIGAELRRLITHHQETKRLQGKIERAVLSELLCDDRNPSGVPITCHTASQGEIPLRVKDSVTIGELTRAIAKRYFEAEFEGHRWQLGDADGDPYDIRIAMSEMKDHLISEVYLYKYELRPLAVIVSRVIDLRSPTSVAAYVARLNSGGMRLKRLRCQFYNWFFNLPGFTNLRPPRAILEDLQAMAEIYAETNTRIDRAAELVKLIERCSVSREWPWRDTMAWVWYRQGHYRCSYRILMDDSDDGTRIHDVTHPTCMYHMYFIFKGLGYDAEAETIYAYFADRFSTHDWYSHTTPDDLARCRLGPLYDLECRRVRTGDDMLMPSDPERGRS
jgi:transcriptional regulator with XRE-family HTH domain